MPGIWIYACELGARQWIGAYTPPPKQRPAYATEHTYKVGWKKSYLSQRLRFRFYLGGAAGRNVHRKVFARNIIPILLFSHRIWCIFMRILAFCVSILNSKKGVWLDMGNICLGERGLPPPPRTPNNYLPALRVATLNSYFRWER